MSKKIIDEIEVPEKIKQQLKKLGIKEEDINNEAAIIVSLYQQALKGKVSAINSINNMLKDNKDDKDNENNKDISKDVKKEERKIKKNLNFLTKEQLKINEDLIHNVAFMSVTLRNLTKEISINGVKEKYKNGANQWGYKDTTEVKTYNNMFKNYQSAMKQLNELIPANLLNNNEDDEFEKFNENI